MPKEIDVATGVDPECHYKIGEAAELLGSTTRTLRFYEEQGMLTSLRTAKGTRFYSEGDIARLRVIQHLVHLDVPLRTIKDLATARPESRSGDEASQKVFALLGDLLLSVEQKKRQAEEAQQQISVALQLVEQCFGCRNKPTARGCKKCPVAGQKDKSQLFHLIWEQGNGEKP